MGFDGEKESNIGLFATVQTVPYYFTIDSIFDRFLNREPINFLNYTK